MTEGAAYVGTWLARSRDLPIWGSGRGENILDGGAFYYGTYETSDGKFMSVGALEQQFYEEFKRILGLEYDQFDSDVEKCRNAVQRAFKTKTQQEWRDLFEQTDACVYPVLDWETADQHPHNIARETFVPKHLTDGCVVARPAPKLSRTPAISTFEKDETNDYVQQVREILKDHGVSSDIEALHADGALILPTRSKL